MLCKVLKCCIRTSVIYVLSMLCNITKRLLRVTLCELMYVLLVSSSICVFWIFIDLINPREIRKPSLYPVILWWTTEFRATSYMQHCSENVKCFMYNNNDHNNIYNVDAYLFYASNIDFDNLPLPRRGNDVIWGLFHEESPRNVELLLHEEALNLFNFSSTFSRFSNVPFPLQDINAFEDITSKRYFVKTSVKNELLTDISPIMYLQSDCETSTERDAYVKELMKYMNVDCYGACLKNKELPKEFTIDYLNNLDEDKFLKFISRYKFVIAIENGVCNDYVTEKFWRAIKVGTVPIYFGSPSIRDWLPNNNSAILLEDYPTPKILYQHLMELLKNDSLYENYLEHKTKQVISNHRLLNEYKIRPYQLDEIKTIESFECFVCEKLHERINGGIINNVVNKSHYDCPKPTSALTLNVNPLNPWIYSWESAKRNAQKIYKEILDGN